MGPAIYSTGNPGLDFFFTLFNGISEVPLFSSPITGILILAGVFVASRKAGAMMALSGLIGAGMAILFGAPYGLVTFGLFGYNSILTGMAFWSGPFVKANKATIFISVFGAAITAVTWMAFSHLMGDLFVLNGTKSSWAIPGFTSSFIFTTWAMMYANKRYGHDIWPAPGTPPKEELIANSGNPVTNDNFKWTAKEFIIATLKGVSQVTFVENWKTGIFWVVGLTLSFELAPLIAGQARLSSRSCLGNSYKITNCRDKTGASWLQPSAGNDSSDQFSAFKSTIIHDGSSSHSCVFGNSNAGFAKIFWNVGTACSNRTFRIYSMGVSARNFGFLTHSRRNWLVKTSPLTQKRGTNTSYNFPFYLIS
jgi:urea transporter